MKVIAVEFAKDELGTLCLDALNGESVRLKTADGHELELVPTACLPKREPLSEDDLRAMYDDPEWVRFENSCILQFARDTLRHHQP